MKHYDFVWDLGEGYIIPDEEINLERVGWRPGQYWQVVADGGKMSLRLVDPLVQFTLEGGQKYE
jgi:hypothetical protein